MKKYIFIISLIAVFVLTGYFVFFNPNPTESEQNNQLVGIAQAQGCCMNPPCEECFAEKGFCDCQEREKNGIEACQECEEAESCGEQADVCIVELE